MTETLLVFLCLLAFFGLPFIISFIVAMFFVEEMPDERRRPSSIKDCFICMFYDDFASTRYCKYFEFFVYARIPIIGFFTTVVTLSVLGIGYITYQLLKLLLYIPGIKQLCNFIVNAYNKIINYKFR